MKYPSLPVMQCDDNCGECCGPVPCTETEFSRVVAYAREHGIQPRDQGITCPWYQQGICQVHPVRPALCRLFGHDPKMNCPHGYNVNLTGRQLTKWQRSIGQCTRMLHEAIPGWDLSRLSFGNPFPTDSRTAQLFRDKL